MARGDVWQRIEELAKTQAIQQEQIRGMSDELQELKKQLKETQDAILQNQDAYYKRMIAVQGSILFLVLSTVIGLVIKLFFH